MSRSSTQTHFRTYPVILRSNFTNGSSLNSNKDTLKKKHKCALSDYYSAKFIHLSVPLRRQAKKSLITTYYIEVHQGLLPWDADCQFIFSLLKLLIRFWFMGHYTFENNYYHTFRNCLALKYIRNKDTPKVILHWCHYLQGSLLVSFEWPMRYIEKYRLHTLKSRRKWRRVHLLFFEWFRNVLDINVMELYNMKYLKHYVTNHIRAWPHQSHFRAVSIINATFF